MIYVTREKDHVDVQCLQKTVRIIKVTFLFADDEYSPHDGCLQKRKTQYIKVKYTKAIQILPSNIFSFCGRLDLCQQREMIIQLSRLLKFSLSSIDKLTVSQVTNS